MEEWGMSESQTEERNGKEEVKLGEKEYEETRRRSREKDGGGMGRERQQSTSLLYCATSTALWEACMNRLVLISFILLPVESGSDQQKTLMFKGRTILPLSHSHAWIKEKILARFLFFLFPFWPPTQWAIFTWMAHECFHLLPLRLNADLLWREKEENIYVPSIAQYHFIPLAKCNDMGIQLVNLESPPFEGRFVLR